MTWITPYQFTQEVSWLQCACSTVVHVHNCTSLPDTNRRGFSSDAHFCGVLCDSDGIRELQAIPLPQPQVPTTGIRRSHDGHMINHMTSLDIYICVYSMYNIGNGPE